MNVIESKINNIADVKLGLLLTEKDFLVNKLEMTDRAIDCVEFLQKYYSIVEGREVVITIEAKEINF